MEQINGGKWLDPSEAERLRDELYYQRAIDAYFRTLPALNVIGMRDGSEMKFGAGYNVLPIWKDRMDSRAWVPTPNADVNGDFGGTYRLHLPPDPPAALFWAVTAYNVTDGTMVQTPQLMPSINAFGTVDTNADGSTDLWFGPEKPAAAPESNWIQTAPGSNFPVALRLYGTGAEFFDQTWKPDVVKVR